MDVKTQSLTSLIGSRICHDLISPIGAITNGLELLEMVADTKSGEVSLISESVENAAARIRFFRISYGVPGEGSLSRQEICSILNDLAPASRAAVTWEVTGDVPRAELRLAFLALQCLETALAYGGTVQITRRDENWLLIADANRLQVDPALWTALSKGHPPQTITPALVQFALLIESLPIQERPCRVDISEKQISIAF